MFNSPSYNFTIQNISDNKSDVLILWTSSSLLAGDESFVKIHNEAGSTVRKEVYNIKYDYNTNNFKFGDNIITNAGFLKTDKLVHSVLPNYKIISDKKQRLALLKTTLYNISETLKYFEKTNYKVLNITFLPISTKIYGEVDKETINVFLSCIIDFFKDFHSITIIFDDEKDKQQYFNVFKRKKIYFLQKIIIYAKYFGISIKI